MPQNNATYCWLLTNQVMLWTDEWTAQSNNTSLFKEIFTKYATSDHTLQINDYCQKEIWSRIEMAKKVFLENKMFTNKLNVELKQRIAIKSAWYRV